MRASFVPLFLLLIRRLQIASGFFLVSGTCNRPWSNGLSSGNCARKVSASYWFLRMRFNDFSGEDMRKPLLREGMKGRPVIVSRRATL